MVSASKDRLSLEQFLELRSSVSMPLMGYIGPIILREKFLNPLIFEKELKDIQYFQNFSSLHCMLKKHKTLETINFKP